MLLIFLFSIFLVARDYIVFPNVKCTAKFADDASIFNNIHCIICKSVSIICEGMVSWWQSCNSQAKSLAAFLYILSSSAFEVNLVVEHWVKITNLLLTQNLWPRAYTLSAVSWNLRNLERISKRNYETLLQGMWHKTLKNIQLSVM